MVAIAVALAAACATAAAIVVAPTTSGGVYSDGQSEYTAFNSAGDAVSVYNSTTEQQVGQSIAIPNDPENDNEPDEWTVVGLDGNLIYLSGELTHAQIPVSEATSVAVANASDGTFTVLCEDPQPSAIASCDSDGPAGYYQTVAMGSQWLAARASPTAAPRLFHYTATDDSFDVTPATNSQEKN